jgi:hypothetical protein
VETSFGAIEVLTVASALMFGNYRELETDCLEFCKKFSNMIPEEIIFQCKNQLDLLNDLSVSGLRLEVFSRRNNSARQSGLSSILSSQPNMNYAFLILIIIISAVINIFIIFLYHNFFSV